MVIPSLLSRLLPDSRLIVTPCRLQGNRWVVTARSARRAVCPACGIPGIRLHGYYHRHPADLPWAGRCVTLELIVRRFCCDNPVCPRRTFGEPFPRVVDAFQRQTLRLQAALWPLGLALGGEAGVKQRAKLSRFPGETASNSFHSGGVQPSGLWLENLECYRWTLSPKSAGVISSATRASARLRGI